MTATKKTLVLIAGLVVSAGCGESERQADSDTTDEPGTIVLENVGFMTPESVLYDGVSDVYLVSNINGSPLEVDDNGFISRVSPDGTLQELKWIDGGDEDVTLNAPKGMAIVGETLFVTDLTVVRMFDRATGAARGAVEVEGSTFLNDLAASADAVYVTDSGFQAGAEGFEPSGTDAVYRVSADGHVTQLAAGDELTRPNGVAVTDEDLWVVTFGSNALFRLVNGAVVDRTELPGGGLDGVVITPSGSFLVSSWDSAAVYRGRPGGEFTKIASDVPSPADIGFDPTRGRLLIPLFQDDKVEIRDVR